MKWYIEILKKIFNKQSIILIIIFFIMGVIFSVVVWYSPSLFILFRNDNTIILSVIGSLLASLIIFLIVKKFMRLPYKGLAFIFLTMVLMFGTAIGESYIFASGPYIKFCQNKSLFFSERAYCYTSLALQYGDKQYCNSIVTWAFNYPIIREKGITVKRNQNPLLSRDFCYFSLAINLTKREYCKWTAAYHEQCIREVQTS